MTDNYNDLIKYLTTVMTIEAKDYHAILFVLRDMRQAPKVAKILNNNNIEYVREKRGFRVKRSGYAQNKLIEHVSNVFCETEVPAQDTEFLVKTMMQQFGINRL